MAPADSTLKPGIFQLSSHLLLALKLKFTPNILLSYLRYWHLCQSGCLTLAHNASILPRDVNQIFHTKMVECGSKHYLPCLTLSEERI